MNLKRILLWLVARTIGSLSYMRSFEYPAIRQSLRLRGGELLLDVGTGGGSALYYLILTGSVRRRSNLLVGVDLNVSALKSGVSLKNGDDIQFIAAAAEAIPFRRGVFHRIVCSSALEHFTDDEKGLAEISETLDDKGILVLTTDSYKWMELGDIQAKHAKIASVRHYYSPSLLQNLAERCGLILDGPPKYLHKSTIARFFIKLGVRYCYRGFLYQLSSVVGVISTRMLGLLAEEDTGFTLLILARRIKVSKSAQGSS